MAELKTISIRGAREHNLKNVDLEIPRDKLIVMTGLSGSGKSSLAFDTIYAEGQRRYVESLSAYARQFLEMMQKPDVDQIEGLSPAISIEQKTTSKNPRSTVGTVTEIYDYLRLLFARVGVPYSPATGLPIESQTVSQMVDRVMALEEGTRLYLLGLEMRNVDRQEAREKALDYLNTFGLSGFENAYPSTLSGGQRQRVALIRTLVMDPDILLLDEPFSALDYQTRLHLEGVLVDAVEKSGKTVILITHDVDEAVALSKRVVVLSGRPSKVKAIHEIDIASHSPVESRSDPHFAQYFHLLCNELDIQTH